MSREESRMAGIFGRPIVVQWDYTWPEGDQREEQAAAEAVASGVGGSLGSELVERVEAKLAKLTGFKRVILCNSDSGAIRAIALADDLGDRNVITSVGTFLPATGGGLLLAGAWPKFVDVSTWTMDLRELEEAMRIGEPAAIFAASAMHDHPASMGRILDIGERFSVPVYNVGTHAFGGTWRGQSFGPVLDGRPLMRYGRATAGSFHDHRAVTGGQLGFVGTDDDELADRVRELVNGDRPSGLGDSLGPNVLAVAVLDVQLERAPEQHETRERIFPEMRQVLQEFGLVTAADPADGDRLPQYGLTALVPKGALQELEPDIVREALSYLLSVDFQPPHWSPSRDPKWRGVVEHNTGRLGQDTRFKQALRDTLWPTPGWDRMSNRGIVTDQVLGLNGSAPEALHSSLNLMLRYTDDLRPLEPLPRP